MLGTFIQSKVDTKDAKCTIKWRGRPPRYADQMCERTLDGDWKSTWYTQIQKGAIGTWISVEMPK